MYSFAISCVPMDNGNTFLAEMISVLVVEETVAFAIEILILLMVTTPSEFLSSESPSSE